MSVRYFKSLLFKSTQIQQEIDREQQRQRPDWLRLLKLKKIRLAIKDRMARIVERSTDYAAAQSARIKKHYGRRKKSKTPLFS